MVTHHIDSDMPGLSHAMYAVECCAGVSFSQLLGVLFHQLMTYPPSTESAAPWMNVDLLLDRKRTASATSCGVPILCIGATLTIGSSLDTSLVMGVSIRPGQTQFILMLCFE